MTQKKDRFQKIVNIKNRRARYNYEWLDTYKAGMSLRGTEIKSIREGKVNLGDAFCVFKEGELYVRNLHITPYSQGTYANHDAMRERKLLLQKKELGKLKEKSEEKGLTIVPTRLFINDRGLAKLEIALARGKKLHDKRDSLKEKDSKRELRELKM
ncbi:MAG: SsrA-binding protein SmpB [Bacteroidota bacterium]